MLDREVAEVLLLEQLVLEILEVMQLAQELLELEEQQSLSLEVLEVLEKIMQLALQPLQITAAAAVAQVIKMFLEVQE